MNTTPNVYIKHGKVYTSTRKELTVKDQRGRKYVYFSGRQINVKSLPVLKPEWNLFYWYILEGLFQTYPCPVIDWWVEMRIKNKYINL